MNGRIMSTAILFVASVLVGYNLIGTVEPIQAQQPVVPSYLELMSMMHSNSKKEESSVSKVDTITVSYDVNTQEVSVKGTTDAIVNVTTTGELKPVVKWRTKVKEVNTGFPKVRSIANLPEDVKPLSPFTKESQNEQE
jgi:hypothetical protein|nr:MAG TPA: hypothetical protein [Caudoviricetes sp.]